jgi:predicted amidophosphoribosyltransferase
MLAKSPAPDSANPRALGVTCCDACAQPVEIVGPLRRDGLCRVCGHGLDSHDVLAAELRRFIQPWLAACKDRGISRQMMASAWDELDGELFPLPEGVPA